MASQFFTPSTNGTSGGGDAVYVAAVPLKAAAGPPQLVMSMAYSLNLRNLQHFMVLIKPSSPIRQEVIVFDFQPVNPESIESAISILSGKLIPGVVMQRKLKNVPRQKCWMVGSSKGNNAMEMAIEFNKSWETDLRVGFHDCRHYTNDTITIKKTLVFIFVGGNKTKYNKPKLWSVLFHVSFTELVQHLTGEAQIVERLLRS